MTITIRPRWSLGRGKTLVPSRWQATCPAARSEPLEIGALVKRLLADMRSTRWVIWESHSKIKRRAPRPACTVPGCAVRAT